MVTRQLSGVPATGEIMDSSTVTIDFNKLLGFNRVTGRSEHLIDLAFDLGARHNKLGGEVPPVPRPVDQQTTCAQEAD